MIRPIFTTESNKTMNVQNNAKEEMGVVVYPNPVHDIFTISVTDSNFEGAKLLDINGVVVGNIQPNERNFDLSNFSSGVYFLKLINSNQVHKLIKQ
jgi:hypothetical protein